ncbi:hypothetical protein EHR03_13125 [Leptospira mayottensis]|uniref:Uncharacterized protein n=1 Tax=Leptospira mayottensis 200901116 TaxID=1192864 RepID=A0A343URZ2_9LEPT|nr:hypothetical protein [Leptospira mayottensis]AVH81565.1 hypothetical protein [Leptospira mayottensis 200901116]TGN00363.1 hypothetical protein EHR03_13125 [Leptospira mayottensis]
MNFSRIAKRRTEKTIRINTIGQTVIFENLKESDIVRGINGDIIKRPGGRNVEIKAFPIQLSAGPKQRDRVGFSESIQAIFYFSAQNFSERVTVNPPDICRSRIYVNFGTFQKYFEVDTAKYYGTLANGFRYVVIGCVEV